MAFGKKHSAIRYEMHEGSELLHDSNLFPRAQYHFEWLYARNETFIIIYLQFTLHDRFSRHLCIYTSEMRAKLPSSGVKSYVLA
jgi:hypothetical protein